MAALKYLQAIGSIRKVAKEENRNFNKNSTRIPEVKHSHNEAQKISLTIELLRCRAPSHN